MTGEPRWLPEAIEDLQSGYDWYDEREPGLGQQLAAEVFKALDQVVRRPLSLKKYEHPNLPAESDVRKMQVKRFNEYGLIYTLVNDTFWIVAVAHAKRNPGYWIDRLTTLS